MTKVEKTMGEVVGLKEYAKKTEEQKRFEREAYHEIVDKLEPIELHWEGRDLEILYDAVNVPEDYEKMHANRPWAMGVFRTVYEVNRESDFCAIVTEPKYLRTEKVLVGQRWRKQIRVTFQTKEAAEKKISLEASALKKEGKHIIYCFR